MKVAYIGGPFRAATAWDIEQNIRRAEETGLTVAAMGYMPLIPHANTRFFHGQLTDEFWLEGTLELLRRCDVMVLGPRWGASKGVAAEISEANRLGIPIYTLAQLPLELPTIGEVAK